MTVKRVSEIEWEDASQAFFIRLRIDCNPYYLTVRDLLRVHLNLGELCTNLQISESAVGISFDRLCFDDYEDAVKVEVAYLEAAKREGKDW